MEKFNCGNGCPLGGADDCFWWKGHESCEHYKSEDIKLPETVEEFETALHNAYLAGAYTERTVEPRIDPSRVIVVEPVLIKEGKEPIVHKEEQ